jgi:Adenylate and Guanylate cyclase catalytic domain/AcrB/AcrD/AcrF family
LIDALLDAGIMRLRPVLITVGATVIALFPLASHGGPLWQPMCYAQIGGLSVATFITLLLVPVIYSIFVLDLKLDMIEIVNRHHGVINKFLGDGFMAVFGAPLSEGSDCVNAVAAAMEILGRVEEEVARGNVLPTTVGIGLHAGEAVTGSIGSSLRKEYAVIGDVVNLASRIEQLNKKFGSRLLISDDVWQTLGEVFPKAIAIGDVYVKGRERAIQIYQVA